MIELKPCPFCGGNAKLDYDTHLGHGEKYNVYFVKCKECGARGGRFDDFYGTPKENAITDAIMAWNKRENAVDIVHCKDCKMFVKNDAACVTYCTRELKNLTVNADDFCIYGERG